MFEESGPVLLGNKQQSLEYGVFHYIFMLKMAYCSLKNAYSRSEDEKAVKNLRC